jgi:hypothetical protein
MARTKRPDGLAPPPASVDALDDLNLDDMFEDGDDTLFDGLDIDLDVMGELSVPSNSMKSGAKISQDLETMKLDLLGDCSSVSDTMANRRKTKRKIKAPPAPDDDGDEEYELRKKKRKSTKPAAKKTKASTAATKNLNALAAMSPLFQRNMSDATNGVAAAVGQFGARNQKKQPVLKQNSKMKGRASPASSASSRRASSVAIGDPRRISAGNQLEAPLALSANPFCGLRPSNTEFFPFMEALPPEPALKKSHKQFPVVYNLHTSMTTSAPGDSSTLSLVPETDPLFRLMLADLDQQNTDRNSSQAAHNQRQANLGPAILAARAAMNQVDKKQLANDLRALCVLLKRQHDFLSQNLENMERWCRHHFTPQDFQSAYGGPVATSGNNRSPPTTLTLTVGSLLASLRSPFIKIKVKCSGFKSPKGRAGPLIAQVRPPGAGPLSTKSDNSRPKVKRKASSMDADRTSVSALSVQEAVIDELQYVDMKPSQRRFAVTEAVTIRAQSLELQVKETQEKRRKAIERQHADLQRVIDDDDHLTLNTVTMWKWMEKSAYFTDYLASDARDLLESIWEPEINEAQMSTRPPPEMASVPTLKMATLVSERNDAEPSDSLFLRLQSLLVHVGFDDEGKDDEGDSFSDTWNFGTEHDALVDQSSSILDLTKLTLEERACIHLKAAGLLDDIRVDSTQPTLVEEDAFSPPSGVLDAMEISTADGARVQTTEQVNGSDGKDSENDIETAIRSMQTDLVHVNRLNNLRIAFLESAVKSHLESAKESKRREEENATILSKYTQLVKRQKEAKRSGRHKPVKKDGDWVPW